MPIKVGINGFGRIGRNIMRTALDDRDIQFVAVNDVTDAKTLAHLLKYDSVLGNLPHKVTHTEDSIAVEGKSFKVFKTKDPAQIDWASVGAEIVVESTGLFTSGPDAKKHLRGTVAMARSQHPDSAGCQFYICYGATPHLDRNYTVFGQVTSGMEHVDRIKQGDRMKTVEILEA